MVILGIMFSWYVVIVCGPSPVVSTLKIEKLYCINHTGRYNGKSLSANNYNSKNAYMATKQRNKNIIIK